MDLIKSKVCQLSRLESLRHRNSSSITLTGKMKKELKALKKRPIDLSDNDVQEISEWSEAVIGKFYWPIKNQVTVRIDADVLD